MQETATSSPGRALRLGRAVVPPVAAFCLAALFGLVCLANLPMLAGWKPHVVLTGSMSPALHPGDVVLIGPAETGAGTLPPGQVVLVKEPGRRTTTYLHRISRYDATGKIVTRGDANRSEDQPVAPGRVLGRARLMVPAIGLPAVWAKDHQLLSLLGLATLTGFAVTVLSLRAVGRRAHPLRSGSRRRSRPFPGSRAATAVALIATGTFVVATGTSAVFTGSTSNVANVWSSGTWATTPVSGELQWWGTGGYAQNAVNNASRWTTAQVSGGGSTWSQVSTGNDHTCALKTTARCGAGATTSTASSASATPPTRTCPPRSAH